MRSNKGAVTLYVLIAMLTITAFLMAIYIRNSNAEVLQTEVTAKIKETYEDYNFNEEYETLLNFKPIIKGYYFEDNTLTIETFKSNNINVDQNGRKILYYAATTTNVPPTNNAETFGNWQNSSLIDISTITYGVDIYVWIKNEDNIISDANRITVRTGESAEAEHKKYVDSTGKTAVIPAGFTVSNITGENTISGGLVVYSNKSNDASITNTAAEYMEEIKKGTANYTAEKLKQTYNQYVWVPVENPSDIYGTLESPVDGIQGRKFGKLYFRDHTVSSSKNNWPVGGDVAYSKTAYREPAYLANSTSGDDSTYNKDAEGNRIITETGIQKEFNDMITSVEKYKGFYIGRYELTSSDETVNTANVVKGENPLGETNWYNFYKACTNLEEKNTEAKDKVRTSMIWGCQWDQAVKVTLIKVPDFLTNASAYGVYSGNDTSGVQVSGTKNAAYNIYDMGGNALDWTIEADVTNIRTVRGGYYLLSSSNYPASIRNSIYPNNTSNSDTGCRAQLYLK